MPTVSIVIPALNERDGIEKTIEAVPKKELEERGYEPRILVVDNDSNDGTGELVPKSSLSQSAAMVAPLRLDLPTPREILLLPLMPMLPTRLRISPGW